VVNQHMQLLEKMVDVGLEGGGSGRPLLMLHDELGFPGWMRWNEVLAAAGRRFVVPLQPGFRRTPQVCSRASRLPPAPTVHK